MTPAPIADQRLQEACEFAIALAREGMGMLRERRGARAGKVTVKAAGDVSSDLDRELETFFKDQLHARFPEHAFLGEEGQSTDVIQMGMGDKHMIDLQQIGCRQVADPGARIDQDVPVHEQGSGSQLAPADAAATAENLDFH